MTGHFLGIDLGGTYVKIGVCDASGGRRGSLSIPTDAAKGPEDTVRRIGAACASLTAETGPVAAACSGVPGPLDLDRRTLKCANNLPGWTDVPYPELLRKALGGLPTFMENDANCAAWGEYVAGAGRGTKSLALYTLGTGVGGGLVLGGEMWIGASGGAGGFGHMSVDPAGPACGCGQNGCVEVYASATAVAKRWGRGTAKECFDAAKRGDAAATAVVDWSADGLARGIANMIHVVHPEVCVLAGGMALAGDFLLEKIRSGLRGRVYAGYLEKIRVEASRVPGDDAGWLGAALWAARKVRS